MDNSEQHEKISGNIQTEIFTQKDTGYQAVKWFCTYHIQSNETFEQAFSRLEPLGKVCEKFIWGEEYGKEGNTPHIQGAWIMSYKVRATTIQKNYFKNGVTLRKLKNWGAAFNYCKKEGNNIVTNQKIPKPVKTLGKEQLYSWQKDIIKIIEGETNDRDIYWIKGEQGAGKTQFIKYLVIHYGAIILNGKPSDMKNGIIEYEKKNGDYPNIIVSNIGFDKDLSRIHYVGYEDIKDMCFYSGKYEGGMVVGNNPHLLIFSNGAPVTTNEKFIQVDIGNA